MADFLDEKRTEIGSRLKELKPLVDEYTRLQAAAAALDGVPANSSAPSTPRRTAGRAAGGSRKRGSSRAKSSGGSGKRRGRPKGSGTRGNEALQLVKANPGITIPELAEKMGIKQNYLYRVMPTLAGEGKVRKEDKGWFPAEAAG